MKISRSFTGRDNNASKKLKDEPEAAAADNAEINAAVTSFITRGPTQVSLTQDFEPQEHIAAGKADKASGDVLPGSSSFIPPDYEPVEQVGRSDCTQEPFAFI
ncbi:MAG: hypothetical protein OXC93_08055 [Rhodospirillaceae bacterium]|nr:hypothetical protein [Rhodospirillaceae bacterium]